MLNSFLLTVTEGKAVLSIATTMGLLWYRPLVLRRKQSVTLSLTIRKGEKLLWAYTVISPPFLSQREPFLFLGKPHLQNILCLV